MRLFVPIADEEFIRLRDLARAERRRVQDQAAFIISQAVAQNSGASEAVTPQPDDNQTRKLAEVR